jgi:dipeptidyl aminopeptidase/acylaminoacyl peptidase
MDADGANPRRLTEHESEAILPAWSPDGTRIAFTSSQDGNREIYVMDADGANQQRLTDDPADDWWPAWSPDGRRIAFASDRRGNYDIFTMDIEGTNLQRLTTSPNDEGSPAWRPEPSGLPACFPFDEPANCQFQKPDGYGAECGRLTVAENRGSRAEDTLSPSREAGSLNCQHVEGNS